MAPLYSIGWTLFLLSNCQFMTSLIPPGGYDASVHMSEEASNAATAIPWAIVSNTNNDILFVFTPHVDQFYCCIDRPWLGYVA
jgi:hypothetical protein